MNINENLASAREHLQEIDKKIFHLIAFRCEAAAQIAAAKQKTGTPTIDESQRDVVLARSEEWAREEGIDQEKIREIFAILIQMNETAQKQLKKKTE